MAFDQTPADQVHDGDLSIAAPECFVCNGQIDYPAALRAGRRARAEVARQIFRQLLLPLELVVSVVKAFGRTMRTSHALRSLSDRGLEDIGLSRQEIFGVAWRSAWSIVSRGRQQRREDEADHSARRQCRQESRHTLLR